MAIDAKLVKELRELTGLPMMDCKKALAEAGGDVEVARENLRKRGRKVAEDREIARRGDRGDDRVELVESDERVDLGKLPAQFLGVPLDEAPGDDDAAHRARALERRRLEDRLDRLLARVLDERARVDHDHVGLGGIGDEGASGPVEVAEHDLGVDEVLRAAEAHDPDARGAPASFPGRRAHG